jgi:hypothetical protein
MTALACALIIRAGFTLSGRLAALIVVFRGRTGFAFATARIVRITGLRHNSYLLHRLFSYMSHRHFT